jgi:hypothetical protein
MRSAQEFLGELFDEAERIQILSIRAYEDQEIFP